MTSIGRRCRCGNTHSRAVLIARLLSGFDPQKKHKTAANDAAAAMATGLPRAESATQTAVLRQRRSKHVRQTRQTTERRPSGRVLFHLTKVVIAQGLHLFPSRTEKLNLAAPMILRKWESRSPPPSEAPRHQAPGLFLHGRAPILYNSYKIYKFYKNYYLKFCQLKF